MNVRHLAQHPATAVALAIVACACAYFFAGPTGVIGMSLGLIGTAFNMWALGRVVKLLVWSDGEAAQPRVRTFLTGLIFLMKLPILIGLGFFAKQVGGAAMPCFLVGLGLVYFATVVWAQAKT